jgi:hypothetical protein
MACRQSPVSCVSEADRRAPQRAPWLLRRLVCRNPGFPAARGRFTTKFNILPRPAQPPHRTWQPLQTSEPSVTARRQPCLPVPCQRPFPRKKPFTPPGPMTAPEFIVGNRQARRCFLEILHGASRRTASRRAAQLSAAQYRAAANCVRPALAWRGPSSPLHSQA